MGIPGGAACCEWTDLTDRERGRERERERETESEREGQSQRERETERDRDIESERGSLQGRQCSEVTRGAAEVLNSV